MKRNRKKLVTMVIFKKLTSKKSCPRAFIKEKNLPVKDRILARCKYSFCPFYRIVKITPKWMAIEGHLVTDESKKDKNGLKNDQIPLDDQLEDMFDYEPEEEDDEEETEGEEFHEKIKIKFINFKMCFSNYVC